MLPSHYWKSSHEIHLLTSQYFTGLPMLFIISLHLLGMEATRLVRISGESDSQPSCTHCNMPSLFLHCLFFNFLLPKDFQLGSNQDFEKASVGLECYVYCGSSFELPRQYVKDHYPVEKYNTKNANTKRKRLGTMLKRVSENTILVQYMIRQI